MQSELMVHLVGSTQTASSLRCFNYELRGIRNKLRHFTHLFWNFLFDRNETQAAEDACLKLHWPVKLLAADWLLMSRHDHFGKKKCTLKSENDILNGKYLKE